MLDLINLSRFAHLSFAAIDAADEMTDVVVAKATYALAPAPDEGSAPSLALTFTEANNALFVSDDYFGTLNKSSVRTESDLAPFKPKCDVIVIGSAHSPTGHPVKQVTVGVDIDHGTRRVLGHSLRVYGERDIVRRDRVDRGAAAIVWLATAGSVEAPEWYLTEPQPFMECPLRYELAFGGEMRIEASDECAGRVGESDRLSEAAKQRHPDGDKAPIAHKACKLNPIGRGFVEGWHVKATCAERYPAPRIEVAASPFTAELFHALVKGRQEPGSCAGLTPQGFGVITKSWQPRLRLAGTYDDAWRNKRWPNPPDDFDMAYWNGAHPSMQCEYLTGGEVVTLTNLLPHGSPGTTSQQGATVASFRLPDDELALRLEFEEKHVVYARMPIDTLTLDLDGNQVHIVWRLRVPAELPVRDASLLCLAPLRRKRSGEKVSEAISMGSQ